MYICPSICSINPHVPHSCVAVSSDHRFVSILHTPDPFYFWLLPSFHLWKL